MPKPYFKTLRGIKNENSLFIVRIATGEALAEIHPRDMGNPPRLKQGLKYQTPGVYLASLNTCAKGKTAPAPLVKTRKTRFLKKSV